MMRLTEKDANGNWRLKDLKWSDLHECNLPKSARDVIYGALCKLLAYEEAGMTPEECQEASERKTPQKVLRCQWGEKLRFGTCPECGRRLLNVEGGNYCQNCGQRLEWKEGDIVDSVHGSNAG